MLAFYARLLFAAAIVLTLPRSSVAHSGIRNESGDCQCRAAAASEDGSDEGDFACLASCGV